MSPAGFDLPDGHPADVLPDQRGVAGTERWDIGTVDLLPSVIASATSTPSVTFYESSLMLPITSFGSVSTISDVHTAVGALQIGIAGIESFIAWNSSDAVTPPFPRSSGVSVMTTAVSTVSASWLVGSDGGDLHFRRIVRRVHHRRVAAGSAGRHGGSVLGSGPSRPRMSPPGGLVPTPHPRFP